MTIEMWSTKTTGTRASSAVWNWNAGASVRMEHCA